MKWYPDTPHVPVTPQAYWATIVQIVQSSLYQQPPVGMRQSIYPRTAVLSAQQPTELGGG